MDLNFVLFILLSTTVLTQCQLSLEKPCFCKLTGTVDECACTVDSVDDYNNHYIYPALQDLLKRDFFRYYKTNINKPCPFWEEDKHCTAGKECGIRECDDEVPRGLRDPPANSNNMDAGIPLHAPVQDTCSDESNDFDPLDASVSAAEEKAFQKWQVHDDQSNKYCDVDDEGSAESHYVDLQKNPERYTGYKGDSAARVWKSIYQENCFKPDPKFDKNFLLNPKVTGTSLEGLCLEKRVFYRIVSGFHTSITVQVASHHYKESPLGFGGTWSRNFKLFNYAFGEETTGGEGPQRLKNLYFVFLLELRALAKAGPYLNQELLFTGNEKEDLETRKLLSELVEIVAAFPSHFDESNMFKGTPALMLELKEEFREKFLNISRIMDCVACDKCRLWGKVNTHGIGTALKILFSDLSSLNGGVKRTQPSFQLQRSDIVALVNSIGRFASSIREVEEFRRAMKNDEDL